MKVYFDFETRSRVKLEEAGAFRYAEDPSTEVICLGYAVNNGAPKIWYPDEPFPEELVRAVESGAEFYAHNITFDHLIWSNTLHGENPEVPKLKATQLRDTAAMCVAHGLPRKLEDAARALSLAEVKDKKGESLINKLSKPNRKGDFNRDPSLIQEMGGYCRQDVVVLREVSNAVPELSHPEQELWQKTLEMNSHGVPIDIGETKKLQAHVDKEQELANQECRAITGLNITQDKKLKEWLNSNGANLENMRAATLEGAVESAEGEAKRVIEMRLKAGGSATKKFSKMLTSASSDGTLKGQIFYHGCSTGRFSSVGINIQNLARPPLKGVTVEDTLGGKHDGPNKMKALSSCVRSVLKAPKGRTFIDADFSSIENRVAYWVVGDEEHLDLFRNERDEYIEFATVLFGGTIEGITSDQRQIAKPGVLGSMYGSGAAGLRGYAAKYSVNLSISEADRIVKAYRYNHPLIVGGWANCQRASVIAVRDGVVANYRDIQFDGSNPEHLAVVLPSGRRIVFQQAYVGQGRFGGEVVKAMGVNSKTKKWEEFDLYSSKLFQNIVQAIARDLFVHALSKIPEGTGQVVATFHDEILILASANGAEDKLERVKQIMSEPPPWAENLPRAAEGWAGERFRK